MWVHLRHAKKKEVDEGDQNAMSDDEEILDE